MADDQVQHLFESFTQADSSTTRIYGGSGLGLAIVNAIVRQMNGHITVETALTKGTTFFVKLNSRYDNTPVLEPSAVVNIELSHGISVLLVEDNKINQAVAQRYLEKLGIIAAIADNGKIALEYAKSNSYDLILMDCHMPVMDGYEATQEIKSNPSVYGEPVVIALTASVMEEDVNRAKDAGMDHIIPKPIKKGKIGELIQNIGIKKQAG